LPNGFTAWPLDYPARSCADWTLSIGADSAWEQKKLEASLSGPTGREKMLAVGAAHAAKRESLATCPDGLSFAHRVEGFHVRF